MPDGPSSRGVVFDLGYKPYVGDRLGRTGAVWAVVRDGLRRVLGLRRRARRKILPWALIALALLPAGFFLAFSVITGDLIEDEANFFSPAEYSSFNATVTLLFIALAASELLVPDRIYGTLSIYASRPLRITDYLGARAGAMAAVVIGFMFLPQLMLAVGNATIADEGFVSHFFDNLNVLGRAALASLTYFAAYAPLAFLVAAVAGRTSFAAGIYLLVFFLSSVTSGGVDAGSEEFGLLALNHHPRYLSDWIFDASTHGWIPERAGFDEWVSLVVIVVVALASVVFVLRRYRRML